MARVLRGGGWLADRDPEEISGEAEMTPFLRRALWILAAMVWESVRPATKKESGAR
jgi:hypothetical protein